MLHNMRSLLAVLALGVLFMVVFQADAPMQGQEGTITVLSVEQEITLLHQHVNPALLQGRDQALLAESIVQARAGAERMLALFPGSSLSPGLDGAWQRAVQAMNAIGYDAAGLGAYELAQGEDALAGLIAAARFPYVASNLELAQGSPLTSLVQPFGQTTVEALRKGENGGKLYDGLLINVAGLNVCVFGLLDRGLSTSQLPTLAITDPLAAAQRLVETCRTNGAELLVALLHTSAGTRLDAQIKAAVPGIDVFVIGGSGELFDPKANPADNALKTDKGWSLSVQAPAQGLSLGKLDLTVAGGQITEFDYGLWEPATPAQPATHVSTNPAPAWGPGEWLILGALALVGLVLLIVLRH